ncbi:glycosyltransferase family 2 protein [Arachidicoccus sp.]|uniref:glycosyltransferase family 2 protein n=1 Tax=Arachidicoccus sp. TaxID=1872624 RepID=UPI003D1A26CA
MIISTYNWPKALDFCLQSILSQTRLPNEVLIADDGSTSETAELIKYYQSIFPIPLLHIWQEDKGFYKTHILNKTVAASQYDYIIQIDGDILLENFFVEDHLKIARKNYFVRGSRSLLNEAVTENILLAKNIPPFAFLRKKCNHKLNSIRNKVLAKLLYHYKTIGKNKYSLIGCNMAFWKKDFIKINGYNEEIVGWGYEDYELAVRLIKAGCKKQTLKMAGIAFHLQHAKRSKENVKHHYNIFHNSTLSDKFICEFGINKYLS